MGLGGHGKKVNVKKIVIFESGSDFAAINFGKYNFKATSQNGEIREKNVSHTGYTSFYHIQLRTPIKLIYSKCVLILHNTQEEFEDSKETKKTITYKYMFFYPNCK